MRRIIFVSVIFIVAIGIGAVVTTKYLIPGDKYIPASDDKNLEIVNKTREDLIYTGWIPDWASPTGFTSLRTNPELFTEISPVWYEVNTDGTLKKKLPLNSQEIITYSKVNAIKIIPAIAMFDHELFTPILQEEKKLTTHIEAIVNEVTENDYDGIDLDYESTKLSDKDKYFEFLKKLSEQLKDKDKTLIVTVVAKWGDDVNYPSLPETRQVQDWSEIAKYANQIRIMTYDYTFAKANFPGPIAPLNWLEEVLDYAVTEVNPNKLMLGIHLYSYEWWTEQKEDGSYDETKLVFVPSYNLNSLGDATARSYTYTTVKKVISENKGERTNYEGEEIFRYEKTNNDTGKKEKRVLVYISPEGVKQRVDLAAKYNLKGVAFWRLGSEDELLKDIISDRPVVSATPTISPSASQ